MIFSAAVPLILIFAFCMGLRQKISPYESLTLGAKDGVSTLLRILPTLVVLLSAIEAFSASGAQQYLIALVSPLLKALGIPPETAPLIFTRPLSGSAALAVGSDIISRHGADSYIGRTAAVMLGSTETTFYTFALYWASSEVKAPKKTLLCALIGDAVGFISAPFCVRLFLGG